MATLFPLLQPNKSLLKANRFSNTAIIVVSAAKDMNRKNRPPQILPPAIPANMLGSVTNIRFGPESGCIPKEKHAGITIRPAVRATNVSSEVTLTASPDQFLVFIQVTAEYQHGSHSQRQSEERLA